jgi:hypothetical protein
VTLVQIWEGTEDTIRLVRKTESVAEIDMG